MAKKRRRKRPESYTRRIYRQLVDDAGLYASRVKIRDTDLQILTDQDVGKKAQDLALKYRLQVESYISQHADFLKSLVPLPNDTLAPLIVRDMLAAGRAAGVGPMAAVAGAIAEAVGRELVSGGCREVMVENGGDIFLCRSTECTVAIFAGESVLSMRVGVRLASAKTPVGICTSSGTIGRSLSLGRADSVTVLSASTPLADAVATRLGNVVGSEKNITEALALAEFIPGVIGAVIICGDKLGAVGQIELIKM